MGAGPSMTSERRKMRCLYRTQSHQKKGVNPSSSGRRRRMQNSHRKTPDLPNNAILCPDLAPLSVFGIKLAAEIIVNNQIKFPSTMHAYHYYKSMKRMSCRYLKRNKIKKGTTPKNKSYTPLSSSVILQTEKSNFWSEESLQLANVN